MKYIVRVLKDKSVLRSYEIGVGEEYEVALLESVEQTIDFIRKLSENIEELGGGTE